MNDELFNNKYRNLYEIHVDDAIVVLFGRDQIPFGYCALDGKSAQVDTSLPPTIIRDFISVVRSIAGIKNYLPGLPNTLEIDK